MSLPRYGVDSATVSVVNLGTSFPEFPCLHSSKLDGLQSGLHMRVGKWKGSSGPTLRTSSERVMFRGRDAWQPPHYSLFHVAFSLAFCYCLAAQAWGMFYTNTIALHRVPLSWSHFGAWYLGFPCMSSWPPFPSKHDNHSHVDFTDDKARFLHSLHTSDSYARVFSSSHNISSTPRLICYFSVVFLVVLVIVDLFYNSMF